MMKSRIALVFAALSTVCSLGPVYIASGSIATLRGGELVVAVHLTDDLGDRIKAAIAKGEYDAILAELNAIIKKDKKNADAFALRGDIYVAQKRADLARIEYTQAIKLNPKSAIFYYKRGMSYQETPGYDLSTALADNDRALALDPTLAGALVEKGYQFNREKNTAEAKAAFAAAVASDPMNRDALYQLGAIAVSEKNTAAALDAFTKAIAADPTYMYSYGYRAETYASLKEYDKALADWAKIIELYPTREYGWGNRATLYATLGNFKLAVADLTQILTFSNTPDGYRRERAEFYEIWGKYDEALADYKTYLDKNSWDKTVTEAHNLLVDKTNAARATAKELAVVFNNAYGTYTPIESDLGNRLDKYRALRDSNLLVPVKGKHPLCDQIPPLLELTAKATTAFDPIEKLYVAGKLKGFSDQLDFAEDRRVKLQNTKKMLERDGRNHECKGPIYYVERDQAPFGSPSLSRAVASSS